MYWPSKSSLTTSKLWKKLNKKMKWTFMGTWTVEDSQIHSDHPEYKLQQNMAYLNRKKTNSKSRPQRVSEESED
jgi:hypothetical protein